MLCPRICDFPNFRLMQPESNENELKNSYFVYAFIPVTRIVIFLFGRSLSACSMHPKTVLDEMDIPP